MTATNTIMRTFKDFWKWLCEGFGYDIRPMIYICSIGGRYGVVRAKDFEKAIKKMRRNAITRFGWGSFSSIYDKPIMPIVYPVFVFSDKGGHLVSGNKAQMEKLVHLCRCELRVFRVPHENEESVLIDHRGPFELVGREGSVMQRHDWKTLLSMIGVEERPA